MRGRGEGGSLEGREKEGRRKGKRREGRDIQLEGQRMIRGRDTVRGRHMIRGLCIGWPRCHRVSPRISTRHRATQGAML